MVLMLHRPMTRATSDRRLRRRAISFIIRASCNASQSLLRCMAAALDAGACNKAGAETVD
jgi:hypothetical protein